MRGDADPDELSAGEAGGEALEALFGLADVGAEDLEVDDRTQAELVRGPRGGTREAEVGRRGDPGAERVGGAPAGDREHLVGAEAPLALDVGRKPFPRTGGRRRTPRTSSIRDGSGR